MPFCKKYETESKKFSELRGIVQVPKFQRGLVWSQDKKDSFIKSLKAGLPIGILLLYKKDDNYLIIDGLQRYTTMLDYTSDYFSYIDPEEIRETDINNIIAVSDGASANYDLYTDDQRKQYVAQIRDCVVNEIRKAHIGIDAFDISSNIADKLHDNVAGYGETDVRKTQRVIYKIVAEFIKNASIDDVEIPYIKFTGAEEELATIFQKLNQEGVKLSKYDVFAATWVNHIVKVENKDFINIIIKKYEAAQEESSLDISDYDPDEMRSTGELTVFEYAFALGKVIVKACPKLTPGKKDESKIESIGFLILAELMGLPYSRMGELAERVECFKPKLKFDALIEAIRESAAAVQTALGNYIVAPVKKKTYLSCQSELQLASYIIVLFKLKYSLTEEEGLKEVQNAKAIKDVKQYLYRHYLFDIIRGYWSGSGDKKLEEIIVKPETCRYTKDVEYSAFETAIVSWMDTSNARTGQTVAPETKLFLNYLLRKRYERIDGEEFDIEHCVPKKQLQSYLAGKVAISSVCNLIYIPSKDNRGKGEKTYYQRADENATSYTLNKEALAKLLYPPREELLFVESVAGLTEQNYREYLEHRKTVLKDAMLEILYGTIVGR